MGQTLCRTPRISVRGVSFDNFFFSSDSFDDVLKFIKCTFEPFLRSGRGTEPPLDSVDRYSPHVIASSYFHSSSFDPFLTFVFNRYFLWTVSIFDEFQVFNTFSSSPARMKISYRYVVLPTSPFGHA